MQTGFGRPENGTGTSGTAGTSGTGGSTLNSAVESSNRDKVDIGGCRHRWVDFRHMAILAQKRQSASGPEPVEPAGTTH